MVEIRLRLWPLVGAFFGHAAIVKHDPVGRFGVGDTGDRTGRMPRPHREPLLAPQDVAALLVRQRAVRIVSCQAFQIVHRIVGPAEPIDQGGATELDDRDQRVLVTGTSLSVRSARSG